MENILSDCCHPWTENPSKNSCSRQFKRIVNALVTLITSGSETQATHFETVMTTVDEVSSDKTKVPDEFIFVVFCLIVLLPNSMSKLIHNRCKLTCKTFYESYTAAYVYANEPLGRCFYVLVCYSLLFSSEIILKQLFASGSVNIVE